MKTQKRSTTATQFERIGAKLGKELAAGMRDPKFDPRVWLDELVSSWPPVHEANARAFTVGFANALKK